MLSTRTLCIAEPFVWTMSPSSLTKRPQPLPVGVSSVPLVWLVYIWDVERQDLTGAPPRAAKVGVIVLPGPLHLRHNPASIATHAPPLST